MNFPLVAQRRPSKRSGDSGTPLSGTQLTGSLSGAQIWNPNPKLNQIAYPFLIVYNTFTFKICRKNTRIYTNGGKIACYSGDCLKWWNKRKENDFAWLVKAEDVLKYDQHGNLLSVNLDIKNPNSKGDFEHLPPEQILSDVIQKEQQIVKILGEINATLEKRA